MTDVNDLAHPDLRCYHHPDLEATSQCDRCGDYLCGECAQQHEELALCPQCLAYLSRPVVPRRGKTACVVNLLAVAVYVPGSWLAEWVWAERGGRPVDGIALWGLAMAVPFTWVAARTYRTQREATGGARMLLRSVLLTAVVGQWVGVVMAAAWLPGDYVPSDEWWVFFFGACFVLCLVSLLLWMVAFRVGVAPAWTAVVSFLSALIANLISGYLLFTLVMYLFGFWRIRGI